jgi:hypothetical protein
MKRFVLGSSSKADTPSSAEATYKLISAKKEKQYCGLLHA